MITTRLHGFGALTVGVFTMVLLSGAARGVPASDVNAPGNDRLRMDLSEATSQGVVDAEIKGQGSIEVLTATFTVKTQQDVTLVIPAGTYLVTPWEVESNAFWSVDSLTVPLYASRQATVEIPVAKAVLEGSAPKEATQFVVRAAPNDEIPRMLDAMVKNGMSHVSKQLAVAILQTPTLSRDGLDGMYYVRYYGMVLYTEEAIKPEDPMYALMAMRKVGLPIEDLRLYVEWVSLVHALGSHSPAVRAFALDELLALGGLDSSFAETRDYVGALIRFTRHHNRSIRYRAVSALKGDSEQRVVEALLPLISDREIVYQFPGIIAAPGSVTSRTVRDAVIESLRQQRERFEDQLLSLFASDDYRTRLAAIDVFAGTGSERAKAMLVRLRTEDVYKEVRDAAERQLQEKGVSRL